MKCKNLIEFKKMELEFLEKSNYSNLKNTVVYHKWFLKNSEQFNEVDKYLTQKVIKIVNAKVKECYHNTWKAVTDFTLRSNLRYFEGFVWSKEVPIPLEHSWLVKPDGKVVDPTLGISTKEANKQLNKKWFAKDYRLKTTSTRENRLENEYLGVYIPTDILNKFVINAKQTGGFLQDYFLQQANEPKIEMSTMR